MHRSIVTIFNFLNACHSLKMRSFLFHNVHLKSLIANRYELTWIIHPMPHDSWEPPTMHGNLTRFMENFHDSWEAPMNHGSSHYGISHWTIGVSHELQEPPMIHGRFPWFMGGFHDSWKVMGEFPWMRGPLVNHRRLASIERPSTKHQSDVF